ncbi:hypothetical protein ACWDYJ_10385 [Streptomyces sp. NPDC003042]
MLGYEHIPLQSRLKPAPAVSQTSVNSAFGFVAQGFEACVQPSDESLLILDFHV